MVTEDEEDTVGRLEEKGEEESWDPKGCNIQGFSSSPAFLFCISLRKRDPPESRRSFSKNQHRVYQMVVTGGLWRHAGPPSGMECLLPQLLRTCLEDSLSGHPSSETASAAESCRPRVAQIRMTEGHGDMRHLSSENLWIY